MFSSSSLENMDLFILYVYIYEYSIDAGFPFGIMKIFWNHIGREKLIKKTVRYTNQNSPNPEEP